MDDLRETLGLLELRRREIDQAILAVKKVLAHSDKAIQDELRAEIAWANPGPRRVKFFCAACECVVYAPAMTKKCPACRTKDTLIRQKT